jgi:hypothetical protein
MFSVVSAESDVARFLFSGHLKGNRVRANAFIPPENDLPLSVCVTDDLATEDIHAWGKLHASSPDREAKGFALLHVIDLHAEDLAVERDDEPTRHAEVAGWPADKEARLDVAKQLVHKIAEIQLR